MFCPNCGTSMDDNAQFCITCGAPAQTPPPKPAAPQYVPPQYPAYPPLQYQIPHAPQQQSLGPSIPFGIVGMILGIMGIFFSMITTSFFTEENYAEIFPMLIFFSSPSGVGIAMSIVSQNLAVKRGRRNGCAVAGIVCSCIGLVIFTFLLIGAVIDSFVM